jgi:hypothetical protein
MNEKPIERLNYFNGQRLQAADLKLEQDYHLRVRRWLNRSLYSSGIADGLVVVKVPGVPRVRIGPGLALDPMGREIILIDEHEETVPGAHDDKNLPLSMYLTIRYSEEVLARQEASCTPINGSKDKVAWGGPSRVLAEPIFEWSRDLPHESSGKVLLAYVALGKGCKEVNVLDVGVRRYVGAASAAKVKQYALEGFRDIDQDNAAFVHFHIRGRQPSSVTLYLRSDRFPTYFYTEMGKHHHSVSVDYQPMTVPAHSHPLDTTVTGTESGGTHKHGFRANTGGWFGIGINPPRGDALAVAYRDGKQNGNANEQAVWGRHTMTLLSEQGFSLGHVVTVDDGGHTHGFAAGETTGGVDAVTLTPTKTANSSPDTGDTGAASTARTDGANLTFVSGLEVTINSVPVTNGIVEQLKRSRPSAENWSQLGRGTGGDTDPLAAIGSGPIRLDFLATLGEGSHVIKLSLPAGTATRNGGRVYFNLYVE